MILSLVEATSCWNIKIFVEKTLTHAVFGGFAGLMEFNSISITPQSVVTFYDATTSEN